MMNSMWKKTLAGITIMAVLLSASAGCGEQKTVTASPAAETSAEISQVSEEESQEETSAEATEEPAEESSEESSQESSASSKIEAQAVSASYAVYSGGILETQDVFTDRDLLQTPDLSEAQYLTVSDGEALNITEAGIYVISGSAEDCTIRVEAPDDAKIQLVLDGVEITNEDFPAIYVVSADKCFVTTADSESSLSVTGSFTSDGDTNTDAVIFSKDDLVLSGTGSLSIASSYGNGISCKDDLKITGGTWSITSALDAIEANDSIAVCGGDFTISAGKDGLHCENDEDDTLGWIWIADGSFGITASSDGIQATTALQIDGGQITASASEGLEATYVQINGGTIDITASDDGINASYKSSFMDVVIEFNGGDITIDMGQGDTDAVDANGSIYVNGGTIDITAPTSSFDYDVTAELNGGTVIINGSQVDQIPADMMGGGFGGGFGGGMMGGGGFGGHGRHM